MNITKAWGQGLMGQQDRGVRLRDEIAQGQVDGGEGGRLMGSNGET